MASEKWKRCKEDNQFLISSWGRIFSLKTKQFIKPYVHNSRVNKYLRVSLGTKKYMVHVLVAMNFKRREYEQLLIDFPNEKITVGHDDRNTLNPNLNNLTWETDSQNKEHSHRTSWVKFNGKEYKGKICYDNES